MLPAKVGRSGRRGTLKKRDIHRQSVEIARGRIGKKISCGVIRADAEMKHRPTTKYVEGEGRTDNARIKKKKNCLEHRCITRPRQKTGQSQKD